VIERAALQRDQSLNGPWAQQTSRTTYHDDPERSHPDLRRMASVSRHRERARAAGSKSPGFQIAFAL